MAELLNSLGLACRVVYVDMPPEYNKACNDFYLAVKDPSYEITDEDCFLYEKYEPILFGQFAEECDVLAAYNFHPLSLARNKNYKKATWLCSLDLSNISVKFFQFLRNYLKDYDSMTFAVSSFFLDIPEVKKAALMPSINPFSDKNKPLPQAAVDRAFEKYSVPRNKKLLTQVSRFSDEKDPLGVLNVFGQLQKERDDISLLLAGSTIVEAHEGDYYRAVVKKAETMKDVYIVYDPSDLETNAFQSASDIIIQKSLKENFGLSVTEAMWKGKPVVASDSGALSLQIQDGVNGLLCANTAGCVTQIRRILDDPSLAASLGASAHKTVMDNFLITRQARDAMLLLYRLLEIA